MSTGHIDGETNGGTKGGGRRKREGPDLANADSPEKQNEVSPYQRDSTEDNGSMSNSRPSALDAAQNRGSSLAMQQAQWCSATSPESERKVDIADCVVEKTIIAGTHQVFDISHASSTEPEGTTCSTGSTHQIVPPASEETGVAATDILSRTASRMDKEDHSQDDFKHRIKTSTSSNSMLGVGVVEQIHLQRMNQGPQHEHELGTFLTTPRTSPTPTALRKSSQDRTSRSASLAREDDEYVAFHRHWQEKWNDREARFLQSEAILRSENDALRTTIDELEHTLCATTIVGDNGDRSSQIDQEHTSRDLITGGKKNVVDVSSGSASRRCAPSTADIGVNTSFILCIEERDAHASDEAPTPVASDKLKLFDSEEQSHRGDYSRGTIFVEIDKVGPPQPRGANVEDQESLISRENTERSPALDHRETIFVEIDHAGAAPSSKALDPDLHFLPVQRLRLKDAGVGCTGLDFLDTADAGVNTSFVSTSSGRASTVDVEIPQDACRAVIHTASSTEVCGRLELPVQIVEREAEVQAQQDHGNWEENDERSVLLESQFEALSSMMFSELGELKLKFEEEMKHFYQEDISPRVSRSHAAERAEMLRIENEIKIRKRKIADLKHYPAAFGSDLSSVSTSVTRVVVAGEVAANNGRQTRDASSSAGEGAIDIGLGDKNRLLDDERVSIT
ncbi:unnamed protein product, partial [Amoebophrya sp. A25]|eukprot:GSA25T00011602001.1